MTPENEAIYNSIVDFREKLLTKDYVVGESISTEDAILLMEASLNLTYRHSGLVENKMRTIESLVSVDGDFSNFTVEYSKVYKTYEDILNSVRNVYASIEERDKKIKVIDLALNRDNTITINTAFEVRTLPLDVPHGNFEEENLKIEIAVHNRCAPSFMHVIYGIETDFTVSMSNLTQEEKLSIKAIYYSGNYEYYYVKNYFVNTYGYLDGGNIMLGYTNEFGTYYSELEGIDNVTQWVINRQNYLDKTLIAFELGVNKEYINENSTYGWAHQTMENKHFADYVLWACPAIYPLNISADY